MFKKSMNALHGEDGHAIILPGVFTGIAGAILLAIGAVNNQDVLTIVGGIALAVGILATSLLQHMGVEYEIYARLEKLERKE